MKIEGQPVIGVDESEEITVAVRADDLIEGDTANPRRHAIAIALRRQDGVDTARVTKNETLVAVATATMSRTSCRQTEKNYEASFCSLEEEASFLSLEDESRLGGCSLRSS